MLVMLVHVPTGGPARALEIEFSGRPVKRDILALYDGRRERQPHETRIHKFAEMPLNYLGLRVIYQDINRPLPDPESLARFRGILTWFVEPLRQPDRGVGWLYLATATGPRLVVLGSRLISGPDWGLRRPGKVAAARLLLSSTQSGSACAEKQA